MSASDNTQNFGHAQQLLQQLKASFLKDLPERCNALEGLVLSLDKGDPIEENFSELYRTVHSLKGSAGTHGFHIITAICHQFEDRLKYLGENTEEANRALIDIYLSYIDLIRQASEIAQANKLDFSTIESELERIRRQHMSDKLSGLVVEPSTSLAMMCLNSLSELPVQLSVIGDGLAALQRLLHEQFDFLITGNELQTLNGTGLICALRTSNSINHNIKIIMITSKDSTEFPDGLKPDHILLKDKDLMKNLEKIIHQMNK